MTGRPRKRPPAGAGKRIEDLAADGFSTVGIAARLEVSPKVLSRWLDESPSLMQAFDRGREKERHTLHNMLYRQAVEKGNIIAAMFLLKARHSYREGEPPQGATANVIVQLPGAMSLDAYRVALANQGHALPIAPPTPAATIGKVERHG